MRHVKMLGLSLVAMFAMSAVATVPAFAEKTFRATYKKYFSHCPIKAVINTCSDAVSSTGSEFKAGNIKVQLEKPMVLQGGLHEVEEGLPHEGEQEFVAAEGAETLKRVKEAGPPLEEVVEPALLSESERQRYENIVAKGNTKTSVTIELAGPVSSIFLNPTNLLTQEGTALGLPVKVKLNNAFLGPQCYVGSEANPINIALTTGKSGELEGAVGEIEGIAGGGILLIKNNSLVNNEYESPGVEHCGVAGAANAALDAKIGLPAPAGENNAVIKGTLAISSSESVRERF